MRTLVSGFNRPILVKLAGKKPTQIAATEAVWPNRTRAFPHHEATPFTDDDASAVLEVWGTQGVVELAAGTPFEDALLEAKSVRMGWLDYFINAFREENARRRADNQGILMPKKVYRDALKELKALQAELSEIDAELLGDPAKAVLQRPTVEDVAAKELLGFGISPAVAPLIPEGMALTDSGV